MNNFIVLWHEAAITSIGFFWMAFWAFGLGYLISSLIQVLVTRRRMQQTMGSTGPKSMALGTFFGFISSSCSFAALSTTRALFQKGAGLAPALAFLLSSTNLVIELGIVIAIFLSWQFVVGEYLGGILLILFAWLFVRIFYPSKLIEEARQQVEQEDSEEHEAQTSDWQEKITSLEGWQQIAETYVMEWNMVWKDVLIGFTIAGILSAFLPQSFYTSLFMGSGGDQAADPGFIAVLAQTIVGPVAAFFTFIGSMGNIPLAAVLFDNGVSFAGVMAFIFSDLVVLPVLRINAVYYGWKMAAYILILLLCGLVVSSITLHYGLKFFDLLPYAGADSLSPAEQQLFRINYGFFLNIFFLGITALFIWFWKKGQSGNAEHHHDHDHESSKSLTDYILPTFTTLAFIWLTGGILMRFII